MFRFIQHIVENPCDLRAALLNHNYKTYEEPSRAENAEIVKDDLVNRFKRELRNISK